MCETSDRRREDLKRLYRVLRRLKQTNRQHKLASCVMTELPQSPGVYFFKESQEFRTDTSRRRRRRIVRVGESSNLRRRLRAHKNKSGASAFRDVVRIALTHRDDLMWEDINEEDRENYRCLTSHTVQSMRFLWLVVDDEGNRKYIESNATMLLSNYRRCQLQQLDCASPSWLGRHSPDERVSHSGLWSRDDVNGRYDPNFLNILDGLVSNFESRAAG